jgi:predicted nucleic acid-binding protein
VIAYLDASVLLRTVLREPNPLAEWDEIEVGIRSDLTRVEAARVIDRLTVLRVLQDEEIAEKYAEVADITTTSHQSFSQRTIARSQTQRERFAFVS